MLDALLDSLLIQPITNASALLQHHTLTPTANVLPAMILDTGTLILELAYTVQVDISLMLQLLLVSALYQHHMLIVMKDALHVTHLITGMQLQNLA